MLKLAWFFVAVFTYKGVFSEVARYDDDFTFLEIWQEIDDEIEHAVYHLRNGGEEESEYANIIVGQCQKLAELVGDEITHLKNETNDHEVGDIIFRRVMHVFQETQNALNHIRSLSDGFELISGLIYNLEIVSEHMEQLVYVAKTYCPQLRAVLRTLLVDFLKCVQGFFKYSDILEQTVIIYESPMRMVSQIKILTREMSSNLQEFSRIEEVRWVFRGFTRYVEEIVQKIDSEAIPDVEVKNVNEKLHKMLSTLTRLITRENTSLKYFQTLIPSQLRDVNENFQQLLALLSCEEYSPKFKTFLEKIVYYYYYSIKQTHFEIQSAYQNAFYGCSNFNNSGQTFDDSSSWYYSIQIKSPKALLIEIVQLSKQLTLTASYYAKFSQLLECVISKIDTEIKTGRLMRAEAAMNGFSQYLKVIKSKIETSTDSLNKYSLIEMTTSELYKVVIAESMQNNGFEHLLVKEICLEFLSFLRDVDSITLVSPKELAVEILKFSKESFNNIDDLSITNYCFREFVQVLDYVIDKIDKEVKIGHLPNIEMVMRQFSQFLKVVKDGLEAALNSREEAKYEFAIVAQMVSTELYKIVTDTKVQDFENLVLKDVCFKIVNFYRNIAYEINVFREEYV